MDKTDQIVIKNILARIQAVGMSQKALAAKAKLNYEGLNRVLKGHGPPSRATVRAIAGALGCSVEELQMRPESGAYAQPDANAIFAYVRGLENEVAELRAQVATMQKTRPPRELETAYQNAGDLRREGALAILLDDDARLAELVREIGTLKRAAK